MFQTGVFPDLDLSFLFCPFWDFPDFSGIFPICSGMVRVFSRFVLFLFLSLLRAPTRNSPERVRDTIWTFPEKSGKHPGLETPRFSFSQDYKKYFRELLSEDFGQDGTASRLASFGAFAQLLSSEVMAPLSSWKVRPLEFEPHNPRTTPTKAMMNIASAILGVVYILLFF